MPRRYRRFLTEFDGIFDSFQVVLEWCAQLSNLLWMSNSSKQRFWLLRKGQYQDDSYNTQQSSIIFYKQTCLFILARVPIYTFRVKSKAFFTTLKHELCIHFTFSTFCQMAWTHTFNRLRIVLNQQTSNPFLKHFLSREWQKKSKRREESFDMPTWGSCC